MIIFEGAASYEYLPSVKCVWLIEFINGRSFPFRLGRRRRKNFRSGLRKKILCLEWKELLLLQDIFSQKLFLPRNRAQRQKVKSSGRNVSQIESFFHCPQAIKWKPNTNECPNFLWKRKKSFSVCGDFLVYIGSYAEKLSARIRPNWKVTSSLNMWLNFTISGFYPGSIMREKNISSSSKASIVNQGRLADNRSWKKKEVKPIPIFLTEAFFAEATKTRGISPCLTHKPVRDILKGRERVFCQNIFLRGKWNFAAIIKYDSFNRLFSCPMMRMIVRGESEIFASWIKLWW